MSVDWEFRNKNKPWLYDGTPTTSQLKKIFTSGKIPGVKVMGLHKDNPLAKKYSGFRVDCGGDCWLHIYDMGGIPKIVMQHFDHAEKADSVLKKVANIAGCAVLNDLEHGETDAWAGKPGKIVSRIIKNVKKWV